MTTDNKGIATLRHVFDQVYSAADLCRRNHLYIPALTLIFNAIDAAGRISDLVGGNDPWGRGRVQERFTKWVEQYLKPTTLFGCTALELYGARCGLMHELAPDSDLFRGGKVRRMVYAWSPTTKAQLAEVGRFLRRPDVAIQGDELLRTSELAIKCKFLEELRAQSPEKLAMVTAGVFTTLSTQDATGMLGLARVFSGIPGGDWWMPFEGKGTPPW